jgi:hypothetical protein
VARFEHLKAFASLLDDRLLFTGSSKDSFLKRGHILQLIDNTYCRLIRSQPDRDGLFKVHILITHHDETDYGNGLLFDIEQPGIQKQISIKDVVSAGFFCHEDPLGTQCYIYGMMKIS